MGRPSEAVHGLLEIRSQCACAFRHGLAHVMKLAPTLPKDAIVVLNLSGRGDKDIFTVAHHLGVKL